MNATREARPIAIVTGAARERGIGAAVCRALAQMEMDVFFTYWGAYDLRVYGSEEAGSQIYSRLCGR